MSKLPLSFAEPTPTDARSVFSEQGLWAPLSIDTQILRTERDQIGWWLSLRPRTDLRRPDVLVYWSATGKLNDGVLLGRLSGTSPRTYPLPGRALTEPGSLMLHSLGHGETFAVADLDLRSLGSGEDQP